MLQGFNTGNAWGNFIAAQGAGQKMLAKGLESLGQVYADKVAYDEKLRLQGIKEARDAQLKQAQGALTSALSIGDKDTVNNILARNPELISSGYAESAYGLYPTNDRSSTPYQQGTNTMSGYIFDPVSGVYSKSQFTDKILDDQAKQAALKKQEQDLKIKSLEVQLEDAKNQQVKAKEEEEEASKEKSRTINTGFNDLQMQIDNISNFANNSDYIHSVSGLTGVWPLAYAQNLTETGRNANAYFENILNTFTMENLSKMSGPLTDNDISILASAASALKKGLGFEETKKELKKMETVLKRRRSIFLKDSNGPENIIVFPDHPVHGNITEKDVQDTMKAKNLSRSELMDIFYGDY